MKKYLFVLAFAMLTISCTKEEVFSFSIKSVEVGFEAQQVFLFANQYIDSWRVINTDNDSEEWYSDNSNSFEEGLNLSLSSNHSCNIHRESIEAKSGGLCAIVDVWQKPQNVEIIFW